MIINLLRCLISGVLFALAFNTSFWILALFAGIPLFQAFLQKNSVKQRLLYISAFGIPFFIISLCWLYEFSKILEFSDFQRALIITIALILIALYLTVYWAVPLIIFGGKLKENTKSVIAFSCIFVLGEWLQSLFYPLAFPWSRLANIIAPFTPFIQSASLFGSLFISLIILLFNGFSALVINNLKEQKKFNHKNRYFRCAVSVVLGNIVLGFFANIFLYNSSDNKSELNVLMVQGNFPGLVRWYSEDEMFKTYINLIEENITTETDLVLTPEIAIPFNFYKDTEKQQKLLDICAENDVILVLGIWTTENNYDYNSMLCLYPDGTYSDVYSKKRLVPFAERLILDDVIDKIFPTLLNNYTVTEGYKNTVFNTYWDCELIEKKAKRKM
ncbi:MAG: apolipoprotein N-acyltransferase, partial [Oscillospiraceae bacterium]|nr:apolipoprotein N-acyltransferase [Oscillospiraceae bacterium]